MGALKQRAQVREAGHYLRVAHRQTAGGFWKFYLGYTVYNLPLHELAEVGSVPERILEELTFGERRMLHYLSSHRNGIGCCYIKHNGELTHRFEALQMLVKKKIVTLAYCVGDVIYFRLADTFAKQQKFNIHNCRYPRAHKPASPVEKERSFLKIIGGLF